MARFGQRCEICYSILKEGWNFEILVEILKVVPNSGLCDLVETQKLDSKP